MTDIYANQTKLIVRIPTELHKAYKIHCINHDMRMKDTIQKLIELELADGLVSGQDE